MTIPNHYNISDLAWAVNGPAAIDHAMIIRYAQTVGTYVKQEANLYMSAACMGACHSMQEALSKFHAKCEFMERAYAQLIAMDANDHAKYNQEN